MVISADNISLSQSTNNVEVFLSYAHRDETLRTELVKHLSLLQRQGIIKSWHDGQIMPGDVWSQKINNHLHTAHIILLLVSADFLASYYCYEVEMKCALDRHEAGEARVIPVILRAVDWHSAPFGKLQALPADGRPVTSYPNQDEVFFEIVQGIRVVAEQIIRSSLVRPVTASSQSLVPKALLTLKIQAIFEDVDWDKALAIVTELKMVSKSISIELRGITKGSVILHIEGHWEELNRIETLFREGKLTKILEFNVQDVQLALQENFTVTTTLYDLISCIQSVSDEKDDSTIVATVMTLLRSGKIRLTGLLPDSFSKSQQFPESGKIA